EVANPRRRLPAGGGVGSVRNLMADLWWERFELPLLARRRRVDVVHHPLPARSISRAQVVTVHDLAFERLPQCFDRGYRVYAHHAHRAAAQAAAAHVCVSQTTPADVRELWGVSADRIVVARHGPGQIAARLKLSRARHFLYVGDDAPRKDLATLLAAYDLYRQSAARPAPLVVAGS